jgi:predicted nucleic acid-binding protein
MDDFIIIDTDILIDAGRKVKEAVDRLDYEEKTSVLGISVIVQMELLVGCRNKEERNKLNRF